MTSTSRKVTETKDGDTTIRTTLVESKTSYESEPFFRRMVPAKTTIINRTSYGGPASTTLSKSEKRTISYGMESAMPSGGYSAITSSGVNSVKESRDQEKKDMQDLNDRFASYIDKVRNLEAQNRKLADDLDKLKQKWGKETTAIKAMYQAELDDARKALNDAEKEKARLEIRCASLEEQIEELRRQLDEANLTLTWNKEKLDSQEKQIQDYENELVQLRKRVESLTTEHDKDRGEIQRLQEALERTRADLDNETLNHIDAENRRQTLEEEIEFLKQIHEQEMKELAALAYRDTSPDNKNFWKNELQQCLREIQQAYDDKLDSMRTELESHYNMKIQEFRTGATRQNMDTVNTKEDNKKIRDQITDLRAHLGDLENRNVQLMNELEQLKREFENKEREWELENTDLKNEVSKLRFEMEAILRELQNLMDTKLGLELEIAAYRKLLEGEESRIGMRQVVESMMKSTTKEYTDADGTGPGASQVVKGQMSAKTTYQRSAKGPISLAECSPDGKSVTVENTGRKEEQLGNWSIKRIIDGVERIDEQLPPNLMIKPSAKVKFFAKGQKPRDAGPNDIELPLDSWLVGANIITKLVNPANEDRATHTQKTTYTS